jgi:hypothetical protein
LEPACHAGTPAFWWLSTLEIENKAAIEMELVSPMVETVVVE